MFTPPTGPGPLRLGPEQLLDLFTLHPVVCTDTRRLTPESLFFALRGERFDGNRFASEALESGCAYAVLDRPECVPANAALARRCVLVGDTLRSLQQLARMHRERLRIPVLAITGTNGKTTTKELVTAVLATRLSVHHTEGNLNNAIGVPLTLLRLAPTHEVAVIEMGASHPGDISELVELVRPDYGLITNVGRAHLAGFGSFEGVKRTKGELYDFLREHRRPAFLNTADRELAAMAAGLDTIPYAPVRCVTAAPFLQAAWAGADGRERLHMTRLVGDYNTANVSAALTVGRHFGIADEDIARAIEGYRPANSRSQLIDRGDRVYVVDAYNANPTSMAAALANFQYFPARSRMAILGDMGELGDYSAQEHRDLLRHIRTDLIGAVWLVGPRLAQAAREEGITDADPHFRLFGSADDARAALRLLPTTRPPLAILIKGSNATRLHTLVEDF